jgi:hypothetical protein
MSGEWVLHTDEIRQRFEAGPLPDYFMQGHPAEVIGDELPRSEAREPAAARVAAAAEAMGCLPAAVAPGTVLVPATRRVRKKRTPGEASERAPAGGEEAPEPAGDRGPPPPPRLGSLDPQLLQEKLALGKARQAAVAGSRPGSAIAREHEGHRAQG